MKSFATVAFGLGLMACGAGAGPPVEDELEGSWVLGTVCFYENPEGPPCSDIDGGRRITFDTGRRRVQSEDARWNGRYRLEVRQVEGGAEEVLIHLPGNGGPAQLWLTGDTLVVSWAYVDGGEERYARAGG